MSNGTDNFPKMPPYPAKPKATAERAVSPAESAGDPDEPNLRGLLHELVSAVGPKFDRTMNAIFGKFIAYGQKHLEHGRRSAMEELAKEKERAEKAEAAHKFCRDITIPDYRLQLEHKQDHVNKLANELAEAKTATRQTMDLSKLNRFDMCRAFGDTASYLGMCEDGDYVRLDDVQSLLAQPLQQECGKEDRPELRLMTKQEVITAMRDNSLLTDIGYSTLLNGDSLEATLEYITQVINYAAIPALKAAPQPSGNLRQESGREDRSKWTTKQWYEHVGAWETKEGFISFGSPMALRAMLLQFQKMTIQQAAKAQPSDNLQQASKPNTDCSGDPANCPDNEGYGCACAPLNKAASATDAGQTIDFGDVPGFDLRITEDNPHLSRIIEMMLNRAEQADILKTPESLEAYRSARTLLLVFIVEYGAKRYQQGMTAAADAGQKAIEALEIAMSNLGASRPTPEWEHDRMLWDTYQAAIDGLRATPGQATPEGADLPPLPEPCQSVYSSGWIRYTADQMRDYARAALVATTAAEPVYQVKAGGSYSDTWVDMLKEQAEFYQKADMGYTVRILYRAAPPQQVDTITKKG